MASLYLNQVPPNPAWLSPALSVVKSAGLVNQDGRTPLLDVDPVLPSTEFQRLQAMAGNDTTFTFPNVRVQLWALAFATTTAPSLYLNSMGGTQGVTISGITVGPGKVEPFSRAWDKTTGLTSTAQEITTHFVNDEVHCCIYGNVYQPNEPSSAPIPDDPNGPGPLLDVAGNRHHAQCNMTIKLHGAADDMAFRMYAANPDPERDQVFVLRIEELQPRELQDWELDELAALGPWIRRTRKAPGGGIPGIEIVVDGEQYPVELAREPLEGLEMDIPDAGGGPEHKLELGAGEARRMQLNARIPDERFVLRTVEVTQTQEDRTVGGARVMVMTVPDELLKPPAEYAAVA